MNYEKLYKELRCFVEAEIDYYKEEADSNGNRFRQCEVA